jgi:hypothetical protein
MKLMLLVEPKIYTGEQFICKSGQCEWETQFSYAKNTLKCTYKYPDFQKSFRARARELKSLEVSNEVEKPSIG